MKSIAELRYFLIIEWSGAWEQLDREIIQKTERNKKKGLAIIFLWFMKEFN